MTDKVYIVIPAYNEGTVIANVIRSASAHGRVVLVDDCSTDDTHGEASKTEAAVLRHPVNLGQGAALQTGIEYALRQGADYIVTFDADGQHDAMEIPMLLAALKQQRVDIVLGSRFLGAAKGMPNSRRLLLLAARSFTSLTTGVKTTDVHNGFRVLSRKAAKAIKLRQNRMAHASELISEIRTHDLKFAEVPVTIHYTEYSKAKGQRLSGAFDILLELVTGFLKR